SRRWRSVLRASSAFFASAAALLPSSTMSLIRMTDSSCRWPFLTRRRALGRYLKLIVFSPRSRRRISAETEAFATTGRPMDAASPSATSRTRSKATESPGAASRSSTSSSVPTSTRYCFPPVSMTAYMEPLGVATDRAAACRCELDMKKRVGRPKRNRNSTATSLRASICPRNGRSTRRSPFGAALADVDALQDSERDGDADQRRAAVADERQRNARDRHHPDHHPDVDHELEQQPRRHAAGEDRPERVLGTPAGHQHAPEQADEQQDDDHRADEAKLLGQDREHEIGVLHRQQALGVLRAIGEPDAEPATEADRDLGLEQLETGALDVGARVEERRQAGFLVVLQDVGPDEREGRGGAAGEDGKPAQARAGHEHAGREDRAEDEGR